MSLAQLGRALAFYGRFFFSFTEPGYRLRRLRWPKESHDFRGQLWLVTGASGGLGGHIAREAARSGARVLAVARSPQKLAAARAAAQAQGIEGIESLRCDFTSLTDVRQLLHTLRERGERIDVLVNNVGVLLDDHGLTAEGYERSFVCNLLSHYQLTEGLIAAGLLGAQVINVTSGGAYNVPLSTAMLDVVEPARFNGTYAYAFHKRAQITLNHEWRRVHGDRDGARDDDRGIEFYVMHPGWVDTEGVRTSLPRFRQALKSWLRDEASGADTVLWLAAKRPPQPAYDPRHEILWFDRAIRPAHVFVRSRHAADDGASLREYLQAKLVAVARLP